MSAAMVNPPILDAGVSGGGRSAHGGGRWGGRNQIIDGDGSPNNDPEGPLRLSAEGSADSSYVERIPNLNDRIVQLYGLEVSILAGAFERTNLVDQLYASLGPRDIESPELTAVEQHLLRCTCERFSRLDWSELQGKRVALGAVDPAQLIEVSTFKEFVNALTYGYAESDRLAIELEGVIGRKGNLTAEDNLELLRELLEALSESGKSVSFGRIKLLAPVMFDLGQCRKEDRPGIVASIVDGDFPYCADNIDHWSSYIQEQRGN